MILQTRKGALSKKEIFFYVTLLLVIITIPLKHTWNSWALISLGLATAFQSPLKASIIRLKANKYWILSIAFYLWLCATWLWDTSGGVTIKHIEGYAIFLAMPLVLTMAPSIPFNKIRMVCLVFTANVIVVSVICLVKSYLIYKETGNFEMFFYHNLSGQIGVNAIYYSNYCLAGICWVLYFKFIRQDSSLPALIAVITCAYLLFFIFLLSSKLVIVLTLLALLLFVIYICYIKRKLLLALAFILLAGPGLALIYSKADYLQDRVEKTKIKTYTGREDWNNGFSARILMIQSALELIKERPILGYGLQGSSDELIKQYIKKDFGPGVIEKYNSHNQYVETTLKSGIIGLIFFMLLILIPLFSAIKLRQLLPIVFLLQYMIQSLVEATLQVQQEQVFFWFFIFLFYLHFHHERRPVNA